MNASPEVVAENFPRSANDVIEFLFFSLPSPSDAGIHDKDAPVMRNYPALYARQHSSKDGVCQPSFNAHTHWALSRMYETKTRVFQSQSEEESQRIIIDFTHSAENNLKLMGDAIEYMKASDKEAEEAYLEDIQRAVQAHADGDLEAAQAAEERISQTDEVDVRAIRVRMLADLAFND